PAIAWTVARIGGGGSPSGGMSAFCKITGSVGASAPFAYSGTEQEFSGVGTWQDRSGGLSFDATLRNVAEYVHSGAAEVPDGALVVIHQATDGDVWVFDRLHYRGVYG
ncbi:MAG: hypothetical protein GY842_06290, partial [bacterium]|nr:hypothetical protein [bacterium]